MTDSFLTRRALIAASLCLLVLPARADDGGRHPFMMENAATGQVIDDDILLSKVSLIFFGYTHCPDICPTSLVQLADVMKALGDDSRNVQPIFVTVDPGRDTSALMREYVKNFDERIVPLRGPVPYTDAMAKAFGAKYEIQKPDGDDPEIYSVDHTASLALIGPDGLLRKRFPFGASTADIVAEVKAVLKDMPPS